MRLGASPSVDAAILSTPVSPVVRTRTPPREGSAPIRCSYGCARGWAAAVTGAAMRSRRAAEIPWQSDTAREVFGRFPARRGNLENRSLPEVFCTDTRRFGKPPQGLDLRFREVLGFGA